MRLHLSTGPEDLGSTWLLVGSATGTDPMPPLVVGGAVVPLEVDAFTTWFLTLPYGNAQLGLLAAQTQTTIAVDLPGSLATDPLLAVQELYFAVALIAPNAAIELTAPVRLPLAWP